MVLSLEETPAVVLLGGPGSGKSTITRYLAWSHAQANVSPTGSSQFPDCLLPGNPIPLRIELRRFAEDRRQRPGYDFFSYATEVLLGRSGLIVNRHMFEMLLERRLMLLLFDGLDEVATLDERRKLIEEIEEIAQRYPGNRMLVTSRPVGYDLIRFSSQFFSHIHIQLFNDEQIRIFLTNWYAHVLRLPVLSAEDQRERDGLYRTLQENPRLHTLAENPLLLTVITSLHRYERLPDRRIRIYDRCADLLLETWAKLRGTDAHWKDMKMSQEDQYACVAHLGYVLHKRSQDDQRTGVHTNDVSARFMLREIEYFLRSRGLIIETADQHKEAKRFLDLVQVEAGIIVERGKDEHCDGLYGFIHRTFQEYFAAADVYERYQQEEDPAIIREFLREHLHDPHWREVVLLLLGKLKRKPVTALLRQLIEGALKCRLSRYTDILQQDLFFVCSCLIEEITVERDVVDAVIFGLSHLIGASSFPAQRKAALECLYALTQTRQYREVARQEVATLMTQYETLPLPIMLLVVQTFCNMEEAERLQKVKQAIEVLSLLIRRKNLLAEHVIQIAELANTWRIEFSEGLFEQRERQALQELIDSPRRFEESDEHSFKLFEHFYNADISLTENEDAFSDQHIVGALLRRLRRGHLPVEQAVLLAETVYTQSVGRYEQRYTAQLLLHVASHPLLPLEHFFRVAQTLYRYSSPKSHERQVILTLLLHRVQQKKYTVTSILQEVNTFFGQEGRWMTMAIYLGLSRRSDLSLPQSFIIFQGLYRYCPPELLYKQVLGCQLFLLIERSRYVLHQAELALTLCCYSTQGSKERRQAEDVFKKLERSPTLSLEERIQLVILRQQAQIYQENERQQIMQILLHALEKTSISLRQCLQIIHVLQKIHPLHSDDLQSAFCIFLERVRNSTPSLEVALEIIAFLVRYHAPYTERVQSVCDKLWLIVERRKQFTPGEVTQMMAMVTLSLESQMIGYADRARVVRLLVATVGEDKARKHLEAHWHISLSTAQIRAEGIPYLVDLMQQKALPNFIRNEIYEILHNLIPQFDKVVVEEAVIENL